MLGSTARTLLSLVLAAMCIIAVLFALYGIAYDVLLLMTTHGNSFASHWIKQMSLMWGETIAGGVIQFLYAIYSPISRRDIYEQRKRCKGKIKEGRVSLEDKFPEPRSWLSRIRFARGYSKMLKEIELEEKKHVISPQQLLANASRRESSFLLCMNKIVEYNSKTYQTDDERSGPNDPPINFVKALQSSTQFMKQNIPSDTIYAICAFLIFKREFLDTDVNGEASRLYGTRLLRNFEDFSDFICRAHSTITYLSNLEFTERERVARDKIKVEASRKKRIVLRANYFMLFTLPKWTMTSEMRCMHRFFGLKQKETLRLIRDEKYPEASNTADIPNTSESDGEVDLRIALAVQTRNKQIDVSRKTVDLHGASGANSGSVLSARTPNNLKSAHHSRRRAAVIVGQNKLQPKNSTIDAETDAEQQIDVYAFRNRADDSNTSETIEHVPVDDADIHDDSDLCQEASDIVPQTPIHPEHASDVLDANLLDPQRWSLWRSLGDLDPVEAIGILEILSSMRNQEQSRRPQALRRHMPKYSQSTAVSSPVQQPIQRPSQQAAVKEHHVRVPELDKQRSYHQRRVKRPVQQQTKTHSEANNVLDDQAPKQIQRIAIDANSKPPLPPPAGAVVRPPLLHHRHGSSTDSFQIEQSSVFKDVSFIRRDDIVTSDEGEQDDLQRITLLQQRRDAKISEGLALFGIESIDKLDDATAFGLAAILHGMEKRDLQQKPSHSKSTSSSNHGKLAGRVRSSQRFVAALPPDSSSSTFVVSDLPVPSELNNISKKDDGATSSEIKHMARAALPGPDTWPPTVTAATAAATTTHAVERVPHVPLFDAPRHEDNLLFVSTRNVDESKSPKHEFRSADGQEVGSDLSRLGDVIWPESHIATSALARPNVKNGLAAFGIQDFEGLDDSTKFGLSAILMGMKTVERQRQNIDHKQSTNNRALRRSPMVVRSNDSSHVNAERAAETPSTAPDADGSVRLKGASRNPSENNSNALHASTAPVVPRRLDIFTGALAMSDGNFGRQRSPYLQSSGKMERELNIPTFDFRRAFDNRVEVGAVASSFNQEATTAAPVSGMDEAARLEGPRSKPFVAWNGQEERLDDSDIDEIFGGDDVSAAGLRAIMRGSSSSAANSIPRKLTQLGRRNTHE